MQIRLLLPHLAAVSFASLSFCSSGQMSASSSMAFTVFWPCAGTASFCAPRILARGAIHRDTSKVFADFLTNNQARVPLLPTTPTVCFDSPGGNVQGAIELGRLIRRLRLDTCLEASYSQVAGKSSSKVLVSRAVCASACAFALAGGVNRYIGDGARYGVHQFAGSQGDIGEAGAQITAVRIAKFLDEMGIRRGLLDIASLVAPNDIHWLSAAELRAVRIDNVRSDPSQWRLDATNDGRVMAVYTQIQPETQNKVTLRILQDHGKPILLVELILGSKSGRSVAEVLNALNFETNRSASMFLNGVTQILEQDIRWTHSSGVFSASVLLPLSLSSRLPVAKSLVFRVGLPHSYEDLDPSVTTSIDGTQRLLIAALR